MSDPGRVGAVARALGFAGLLPQVAAVGMLVLGRRDPTDLAWIAVVGGYTLAIGYGGLILSFLGGVWWSQAMRRDQRQGRLAFASITPSLVALAVGVMALGNLPAAPSPWPAVALGSAIMLTLLVDRHLVQTGEAPDGWMRLRVPLSLGLGGLTIVAGVLVGI